MKTVTGLFDRDDQVMAAIDALSAAGVPVTRCLYEGGIHGFMTMPMLDIAHEARREASQALRQVLDR